MFSRKYSLRKARHVLKNGYSFYKKKGHKLSPPSFAEFEKDLRALDNAILNKNRDESDRLARKIELFCKEHFKKSFFAYTGELIVALVLALAIATVVRQSWFELYEIPTGSMRPTFKEQDHLTVSKLPFGINIPLRTEHFYFDPNLVQRTSALIFSGDKIPFIDEETTYFWILPYTKRYIKRLIGKPGDQLYFYGGKIYGVDHSGNLIEELIDSPWMHHLEHIPFLTFEGRITTPDNSQILFHQMNKPIGKLSLTPSGTLLGQVFNGSEWIKDQPSKGENNNSKIQTYSDFFGMRNFAMARLLTKEQLKKFTSFTPEEIGEGVLYLELRHSPSLTFPEPRFQKENRGYMISLVPQVTVIPLQQNHLDALIQNMYTARFVVSNEHATRYRIEGSAFSTNSPSFPGIPDGTYEFYYGKAMKVGWAGITSELSPNHPLYSSTPANVQRLFNLGIEFDKLVSPNARQFFYPQRYAYFRDGDLYLLGAPILQKNDPVLTAFNESEASKEEKSSNEKPYIAFKDHGAPLNEDGTPNIQFLEAFGFRVPDKHYFVLGDNHAMSSDSRVFGFVPEANLQGAPSLIIWPPGSRIGPPMQKPYPIVNTPRLIIWGIALAIFLCWWVIHYRNRRKSIFQK